MSIAEKEFEKQQAEFKLRIKKAIYDDKIKALVEFFQNMADDLIKCQKLTDKDIRDLEVAISIFDLVTSAQRLINPKN